MARLSPRLLVPAIVIAGLAVGGWYIDRARESRRSALSGFFETQPIQLSSRVGGRVAEILVREGDPVSAGQPILRLNVEPNREETQARRAQAAQAAAAARETRRGPREEDIRRQVHAVAEQRAILARLRRGPLPEEIRAARDRSEAAEAAYRKALAGPRPQEVEQARAAERNAAARLAQAERGLTPEEKAQARARLEAAEAPARLAREDLSRAQRLYDQGAVSRQFLDRARAESHSAEARTRELAEALQRALAGTPAEELAQVLEAHRQARAALALVLAGTRREDIEAARAESAAARESLLLLQRGSRREDIAAAEARLQQAEAAFAELRNGSRPEQIQQAESARRAAVFLARASEARLEDRVVRAPSAALVERVLVAVGDLIPQDTVVARLNDPGVLWIRFYVPESQLASVRPGDSAELRVDGLAGAVAAVVESVASRGEFTPANLQTPEERGKQVFAVRLRLRAPDSRIKPGMFATAQRIGALRPRAGR